VRPEQKGLPAGGARRVAGLRREEVAMLAGISVDYYLRLERGRDRNPSSQVLDAIARVLDLDAAHAAHAHALAAPERSHPPTELGSAPPPGVLGLLHALAVPAFVENRRFDVVAANTAARALSPRLSAGRNRLRDLLLDDEEQGLVPSWREAVACLVASLRQAMGEDRDPVLVDLIVELAAASARFRKLWARHEVQGQYGSVLVLDHPVVGELALHRERLEIAGAGGAMLVTLHAIEGSPDADKLARLLRSAADTRH